MTIRLSPRAFAPALALAAALGFAGTALAGTATDNATASHKTTHAQTTHAQTEHHPRLSGYTSMSQAKSACGASPVVWHAKGSKVFHAQGSKYFGKTRHGAYVCEKAAESHGLHKSKY